VERLARNVRTPHIGMPGDRFTDAAPGKHPGMEILTERRG
jgi:hypothetical protein